MIDKTAKQFFDDIRSAVDGAKDTLLGEKSTAEQNAEYESPKSASHLKALVEAGLKRMNLVTREEFDAQQAVMMRTREKLEALELLVKELESKINDK